MTDRETDGAPDFVQVYQDQLVPVWRYVRSRIPNHQEAEDVTSEVFARAWKSWGRFDPGRGAAPWLLRIAQRTVVDSNRRHGRWPAEPVDLELVDNASSNPAELPEAILLAKEVLTEVSSALQTLSDRERDGIALRFGAGLKMADVGRILGLSTAATKMMMARSLTKLSATLAQRRGRQSVAQAPLVLDDLVDQALLRGRSAVGSPAGRRRPVAPLSSPLQGARRGGGRCWGYVVGGTSHRPPRGGRRRPGLVCGGRPARHGASPGGRRDRRHRAEPLGCQPAQATRRRGGRFPSSAGLNRRRNHVSRFGA